MKPALLGIAITAPFNLILLGWVWGSLSLTVAFILICTISKLVTGSWKP